MCGVHLTGVERRLPADDLIVSKTDQQGRITYANRTFLEISGYREEELIGRPHNILRHPAMPRCVFKYLWDTISAGREVFAYVVNRCKNGDHYWVFAHVTPTYDPADCIVSYHSNRRAPLRSAIHQIEPIYRRLLEVESRCRRPRDAWQASLPVLQDLLSQRGVTYDEWIFSLSPIEAAVAAAPPSPRPTLRGLCRSSGRPGDSA
ncbi:MAG: PAS domain-containing protein [Planctomycetaceae bacterium]|nr:PAS domain-containing protein [Planctomycetaceae bacterium]